jgi:hypothetical protein
LIEPETLNMCRKYSNVTRIDDFVYIGSSERFSMKNALKDLAAILALLVLLSFGVGALPY